MGLCSGRVNHGRSPSPHRGPITAATTPGTQNSGVSQQVRQRTARQPGGYFDALGGGIGDAASYATSAAHFAVEGALLHPEHVLQGLGTFDAPA